MKNEPLIHARKAKGWTQEQFADLLGCQKTTVSNWENGVSSPKLADAFTVSELLGQDINELFSIYKLQENHNKTA
jgi:putative transcriptional regulator